MRKKKEGPPVTSAERSTTPPLSAAPFNPLEKRERMRAAAHEVERLAAEFIAEGEPHRERLNRLLRNCSGDWAVELWRIAGEIPAAAWNDFRDRERMFLGSAMTPNACAFYLFAEAMSAAREQDRRRFDDALRHLSDEPEWSEEVRGRLPRCGYGLLLRVYRLLVPSYRQQADAALAPAGLQLTEHAAWELERAGWPLSKVASRVLYFWLDYVLGECPTHPDPATGLLRAFADEPPAPATAPEPEPEPPVTPEQSADLPAIYYYGGTLYSLDPADRHPKHLPGTVHNFLQQFLKYGEPRVYADYRGILENPSDAFSKLTRSHNGYFAVAARKNAGKGSGWSVHVRRANGQLAPVPSDT